MLVVNPLKDLCYLLRCTFEGMRVWKKGRLFICLRFGGVSTSAHTYILCQGKDEAKKKKINF